MKVRTAILACAASLVAATGAHAQLPPGSYKDTCTNEAVSGNTLKARCKTMAGTLLDSSLNLPCAGMVENINGKLVCKQMPPGPPRPPAGAALPAGSYQQTCSGEKVAGGILTATCQTKAGTRVATTLTLPCNGPIENIDGKLTCKGAAAPPRPAPLPPGSYKDTCTHEEVTGNTLKAKCKTMAGTVIDTSLNLPCAGPIENINGKLTCKPAGGLPPKLPTPPPAAAPLPPGSYQQTCTGEKVVGNTLMADCKRKDQSVAKTQLVLPCAGRIENQDGKLACIAGR